MKRHLIKMTDGLWSAESWPMGPFTLAWIARFAGMTEADADRAMQDGQFVYAGGAGYTYE